MRKFLLSAIVSAIAFASAGARAEDCVNTVVNNPAFSSSYLNEAKPCPPPVAKVQKSASTTATSGQRATETRTAAAKPVTDPDHATVTHTPTGTLLKFGETTVCMSGSVSVDMVAGNGHPRPTRNNSPEPACN